MTPSSLPGASAAPRWTLFLLALLLGALTGCQYYEEYRVLKATADLREEQAELLHAYRRCLEKYEDDTAKAKERCSPHTQTLREIEIKRQAIR